MIEISIGTKTFTAICLASLLTFPSIWMERAIADQTNNQREGLPGRRIGGGTRGGTCIDPPENLIALVPANTGVLTAKTYPDLLFYIPGTTTPLSAKFELRDQDDHPVYQTTFTTAVAPKQDDAVPKRNYSGEIVSLNYLRSLDAHPLPQLTLEQIYHWSLAIVCDPTTGDDTNNVTVDGWVKRVKPNPLLTMQLAHKSVVNQVKIYQKFGLWEDALVTVAQLKDSKSIASGFTEIWTQLLKSEKFPPTLVEESPGVKFRIGNS
jgi:hypothetical protein